jgi:DNA recombination protein RmuC
VTVVWIVLAFVVGAVLTLVLVRQQAAARIAALEVRLQASDERHTILSHAEQTLRDAFRSMASEALQANSQSLTALAQASLEKTNEQVKGDLDRRQAAIADLVRPLADTLQAVDQKLGAVEKDRIAANASLAEQLKQVGSGLTSLQGETGKLVKALRQPHVRGHWGEVQLRQVVELAGMIEHTDFLEQVTLTTEDGRFRPDLVVRLPGGKCVIVDAKTPLSAYFDAVESQDDAERALRLGDHARQVRDHLGRLGSKAYWNQFEDTPEFVVMFLPGEALFSAALSHDPLLIEHGITNRVVLASPTTLIALLKAVSYGWRQERLQANAQQISDLGRELYQRLLVLATHYDDVKRGLDRAVDAYNRSVASLETRVLVTARRFRDLGASSGDDIPALETIEKTTREVQAPEVRSLFDDE